MDKEYIEREAATTLFARACGECKEACEEFDGFYADCDECLLHGVLKEFASIPAADVRPVKRGKWVKTKEYYTAGCDFLRVAWKCSCCGIEVVNTEPIFRIDDWYYCPNCGAKMEELTE